MSESFDPYQWLAKRGWEREIDAVHVYIGPRVRYNGLQVKGKGYDLLDAIQNAIDKGNALWF